MSEYVPGEASALLAGFVAGSRVAGYQLEGQLGAGGTAVVFRARHGRLGRMVALKILAPGLATDAAFRQRFIRESRAATSSRRTCWWIRGPAGLITCTCPISG